MMGDPVLLYPLYFCRVSELVCDGPLYFPQLPLIQGYWSTSPQVSEHFTMAVLQVAWVKAAGYA